MTTKGRYWLAGWLLFALVILGWVIARQSASFTLAAELTTARTERSAREAQRAALLRRIRKAESRAVLVPRAEALGLRLPVDSEIVILQLAEPERP